MTVSGWTQIVVFVVVLTALTPLLGGYMARVYQGRRVRLSALGEPTERLLYRLVGVDPSEEQDWKAYARSMLAFSCGGWLVLRAPQLPRSALPRATRTVAQQTPLLTGRRRHGSSRPASPRYPPPRWASALIRTPSAASTVEISRAATASAHHQPRA